MNEIERPEVPYSRPIIGSLESAEPRELGNDWGINLGDSDDTLPPNFLDDCRNNPPKTQRPFGETALPGLVEVVDSPEL